MRGESIGPGIGKGETYKERGTTVGRPQLNAPTSVLEKYINSFTNDLPNKTSPFLLYAPSTSSFTRICLGLSYLFTSSLLSAELPRPHSRLPPHWHSRTLNSPLYSFACSSHLPCFMFLDLFPGKFYTFKSMSLYFFFLPCCIGSDLHFNVEQKFCEQISCSWPEEKHIKFSHYLN